jgi:hypothetical protein
VGPADMWFYGDYKTMKEFLTLYETLESQMFINSEFHKFIFNITKNEGNLSNSIGFYKFWMIKNGLWDKRENLNTIWESECQ